MRWRPPACLLLSLLPPALLSAALLPAGTQRGGMGGNGSAAIVVTLASPAGNGGPAEAGSSEAAPPATKPAARVAQQVAADAAADAAADPAGEGAAYLPAAQLTERPQLLQDIAPDWHAPQRLPQRMVCTLLVSEYGDVDRVLCDDPALAPASLQAVGERFRAARFAPGRLYGRPVRSTLRIELRLD